MEIRERLSGGDLRTLKGVDETIALVAADSGLLPELFDCIFDPDDVVRMRAADAAEKLCRERPERFAPFVERLLTDVAKVDQASVQWHLAQMLGEVELDAGQRRQAVAVLVAQLDGSDDWIVVNLTLETLARFTQAGEMDSASFAALLDRYAEDRRKAVRARVRKLRALVSP